MIDQRRIDSLLEGGDDLLINLFDIFRTVGKKRLDEMSGALESRDYPTLYRLAHTFKSSGANFGATQIFENCKLIEGLAKEEDSQRLEVEISLLKVLFKEVVIELDQIVTSSRTK